MSCHHDRTTVLISVEENGFCVFVLYDRIWQMGKLFNSGIKRASHPSLEMYDVLHLIIASESIYIHLSKVKQFSTTKRLFVPDAYRNLQK